MSLTETLDSLSPHQTSSAGTLQFPIGMNESHHFTAHYDRVVLRLFLQGYLLALRSKPKLLFFFFFFSFFVFVYFSTRVSSLKLRAMLIGEFVQISPSFVGQVVCFLLSTRPVAEQTRGKRSHRPMALAPPRTWSVSFALCHGAPCCQHTRQFGSSWSNTRYRSLGGKKKDEPNSCWSSWAAHFREI